MQLVTKFLKDEDGATLIEYGLLAALISVVAMAAMQSVGNSVDAVFTEVADVLEEATADLGGEEGTGAD